MGELHLTFRQIHIVMTRYIAAILFLSNIYLSQELFFRTRFRSRSSLNTTDEDDDSGLTQNTIVGLFDAVTGLTHGIGDVIEQFGDGFDQRRPGNNTAIVTKRVNATEGEEDDDEESVGSEVVVGLFDSLRMFTQNVGKLVNIVGDRLEDRRDGVVRVASEVDSQVSHIGDNIMRWKNKRFGLGNKKTSSSVDSEEEEIIIVSDVNENDIEETTFSSLI